METSVSRSHAGLMTRVFSWMFAGLSLTGIISFLLISDGGAIHYFCQNIGVLYGLMIVELLLVFFLAARVHKMAAGTATFVFFLYAAFNGVTLAPLLYIYTPVSDCAGFLHHGRDVRGVCPLWGGDEAGSLQAGKYPLHGTDRFDHRIRRQLVHAELHPVLGGLLPGRHHLLWTDSLRYSEDQTDSG